MQGRPEVAGPGYIGLAMHFYCLDRGGGEEGAVYATSGRPGPSYSRPSSSSPQDIRPSVLGQHVEAFFAKFLLYTVCDGGERERESLGKQEKRKKKVLIF